MTSFSLAPLEGGDAIPVKEGKTTVGRGSFLSVNIIIYHMSTKNIKILDKRVSRNHAIIEVSDATLKVLPVHTNPTFYKGDGATKFEALEKDNPKELKNGDCISFLPNDLVFKVVSKNEGTSVFGQDEVTTTTTMPTSTTVTTTTMPTSTTITTATMPTSPTKIITTAMPTSPPTTSPTTATMPTSPTTATIPTSPTTATMPTAATKNSHVIDSEDVEVENEKLENEELEEEENHHLSEEKEELPVIVPLKKTRNLPSWMTNSKDKTPNNASKKGSQKKAKKTSSLEMKSSETVTSVEGKDKKSDEEDYDEDKTTLIDELAGSSTVEEKEQKELEIPMTEKEQNKRKRDESDESDIEQDAKREKPLPRCPYGNKCYRKNPVHFQEYSHDDEQSVQSQSEKSSSEDDEAELPECPHGMDCYRRNPKHRKEYKHTATPRTRERKAKTKAGLRNIKDDDDTADDEEYDDSFIDDESSFEPSENDDSDWKPDDDGIDDEDVGELLAEAKGFSKNKKMLKPS